jgi:hypothetical protein
VQRQTAHLDRTVQRQTAKRQQIDSRQTANRQQTDSRQKADRQQIDSRQTADRQQTDRRQTPGRQETGSRQTDTMRRTGGTRSTPTLTTATAAHRRRASLVSISFDTNGDINGHGDGDSHGNGDGHGDSHGHRTTAKRLQPLQRRRGSVVKGRNSTHSPIRNQQRLFSLGASVVKGQSRGLGGSSRIPPALMGSRRSLSSRTTDMLRSWKDRIPDSYNSDHTPPPSGPAPAYQRTSASPSPVSIFAHPHTSPSASASASLSPLSNSISPRAHAFLHRQSIATMATTTIANVTPKAHNPPAFDTTTIAFTADSDIATRTRSLSGLSVSLAATSDARLSTVNVGSWPSPITMVRRIESNSKFIS